MRILIVDDDHQSLSSTSRILEHAKHEVKSVSSGAEALDCLKTFQPQLIVTDVRMPGMSGIQFVDTYQKQGLTIPFIVMTAFGEVQDAVWAIKMGVVEFLLKPFNKQDLCNAVNQVFERTTKSKQLKNSSVGISLIGSSNTLQKLRVLITQVANTDASVLVLGESGSGKEQVSKLIHEQSSRARQPFIAVNCAAIPENLIESELFGYEKGAFSGAEQSRIGLIEAANGGTLMLDEIGDMPLSLQPKLLRVLETQTLRRLGSTQERKLNVRVIAATHQNLIDRVKNGLFRQDLYYRLDVMPLPVPALRDHLEDIPELTQFFINKFSLEYEKTILGIDPEALAILLKHSWPGNVRELSNVLERAVVLCVNQYIQSTDFPIHLTSSKQPQSSSDEIDSKITFSLGTSLKEMEDVMIHKTLNLTKGDRAQAAKLLGVNERTIYRKINRSKED